MKIAMIAHDEKKIEMMRFASQFKDCLSQHKIVATGTTGTWLNKFLPKLRVKKVASGPMGGDAQIAAMIVKNKIDAVLFFIDPMSSHPHDPDINGLIRISVAYDVALALNPKTAASILKNLDGHAPVKGKRRNAR